MITRRLATLLSAGLICGAVAGVTGSVATAAPVANAAANCSVGSGQHDGPTYLTALSVSGTSCGTGLAVVKAYHACQLKHGGVKGTCSSTVDGFRCTEKRGPSIATEFISSVSCTSHAKRVAYKYEQFT
jgi:hypothetical protein